MQERTPKHHSRIVGPIADELAAFHGATFDNEGLAGRIDQVARLYGRYEDAATAIGVSITTLRAWKAGLNIPGFDSIARLALGQNVSLRWLATGLGQMSDAGSIDRAMILGAIADLPQGRLGDLLKAVTRLIAAKDDFTEAARLISSADSRKS